jgi:putative two-component system response regulator
MDEAKGFSVGAADYVTKPVSPMIVLARIETHIALSNQKMELRAQVKEQTKEIADTRMEIIRRLGKAVEFKDENTGLHIERVSKYSYYIALSYGMDDFRADGILNAAPMHDIGKIGVPEDIIHKKGKLTEQEYNEMKKHCEVGNEILGDSEAEIIKTAKIIALQHHEKWNGTGYPYGLEENDINIFARIVALADVFDALTTKRPYKEAWDNQRALDLIISEKGKHFDPNVVDAFINTIDDIYKVQEEYSG